MTKRVKIIRGKKLPENTKNVTRISRWGNPFKLKKHGGVYSLPDSLYFYKLWLEEKLTDNPNFLAPLIGVDLGCYCELDEDCHADILLLYLEEDYEEVGMSMTDDPRFYEKKGDKR